MTLASPRILILRSGHTDPAVTARAGDFDRWFIDRMRGLQARFDVVHVPDEGIPAIGSHDGVLVTGTPASVLDGEDWMRRLGDFLAADQGPPTLAVCFGFQLAAAARGGVVRRNPRGWEIGTVQIHLTADGLRDPLFAGLSNPLTLQTTHEDAVIELPAGVVPLASNDHTPHQALAAGRLRAVQFHPEADAAILRLLVNLRRGVLQRDALGRGAGDPDEAARRVDHIEATIRDSPDGRRILANWLCHHVRGETPTD